MKTIKHLVVFDFDGTLFKSPRRPDNWRGKWWGNTRSLEGPLVPDKPDDSWWNDGVCEKAFEFIADKNYYTVMLTGRKHIFSARVAGLLRQKGLNFQFVGLSGEDGAAESKLAHVKNILSENPFIDFVTFYDDREEHFPLFRDFCVNNKVGCEIIHVPEAYTTLEGQSSIKKNKLFVLVGPPGAGKSTWIRNSPELAGSTIISRDDLVDEIAEENGLTYNDMWSNNSKIQELNKHITYLLQQNVSAASKSEKNVIIDMTNMNIKSRKQFLDKFSKKKFTRVAVDFMIDKSNIEKLLRINQERDAQLKTIGKSKRISREVVSSMLNRYEKPTEEEGFDRVTMINVDDRISKISV